MANELILIIEYDLKCHEQAQAFSVALLIPHTIDGSNSLHENASFHEGSRVTDKCACA